MLIEIENNAKCGIIVSKNDNILEMKITGKLTEFSAEQLLKDIPLLTKEYDYRNYLFDLRSLNGTLGIGSSYFYIEHFSFERSKNIAIVAPKESELYYSFIETVAYNRRINLRYFDLIENAKDWLEEEGLRG
ncbi:MAG: STAS/SEC14 domain-containing protein [Ignavibacteriaceae bacterium]|jgi:hypothetical protein